MIPLLSSRLVCHGNWYKGKGEGWDTSWHFILLETLCSFRKIPCHLVALLTDNAILTSHSSLGLFYCVYTLLTWDQFVCIFTHLILLYLVFELNNKVFLNQVKPFAEFTMLFATLVQCWHTYQKSYITCIDPQFLWVQSIISIIYHP